MHLGDGLPNICPMSRTSDFCLRVALISLLGLGALVGRVAAAQDQPERLTPAEREEIWRRMTPEQREQLWHKLSPEQKLQAWQRLSPEQRQAIRDRMTPEQREAMRNRMLEERPRRLQEGGDDPGADAAGGGRRLSPDERQRLRDQITESNRELARDRADGPHRMARPSRPLRDRK